MRIEGTPSKEPSNGLRGVENFVDKSSQTVSENLRGLDRWRNPPKEVEDTAEDVGDVALGSVIEDPKEVHEIAPGVTIIQRDSGASWEIEGIREGKRGQVVNLVIKKDGEVARRLTLGYDDLSGKLNTEGSPWHW